ncbi:MAG: hypothetical protein IT462_17820 [Planctomycetes bacterium]|nr:hypothetical protein [Planctomycetota bacterium]
MLQTATQDIRQIRQALEANSRLTSLSGSALVLSGILAFTAAGVSSQLGAVEPAARKALSGATLSQLVLLWSATLVIVVGLNLIGMVIRARTDGQPLATRLGKRVLFAMLPSLFVGGALTLALMHEHRLDLVFAVWMLCYGAALIAASAHSITSVRLLGLWMLLGGGLALLPAVAPHDYTMFLGSFGAGHFLLGAWVGLRYGW